MIAHFPSVPLRRIGSWRRLRQARESVTLFFLLVLFPALAQAQIGGSPFDTGLTNLQTLFTGTVAKVASLIAIVVGGYESAHGEPGAKRHHCRLSRRQLAALRGRGGQKCHSRRFAAVAPFGADPVRKSVHQCRGSVRHQARAVDRKRDLRLPREGQV